VPSKRDDEGLGVGLARWFLMALQVLAMALCACMMAVLMMDSVSMPPRMCLDGSPLQSGPPPTGTSVYDVPDPAAPAPQ
jgi:hypothetical protein